MKKALLLLFLILCVITAASASSESPESSAEARELTSLCTFRAPTAETRLNTFSLMTDQDVSTY